MLATFVPSAVHAYYAYIHAECMSLKPLHVVLLVKHHPAIVTVVEFDFQNAWMYVHFAHSDST